MDLQEMLGDFSRVGELEQKITEARQAYYNGTPSVPDAEYDAWVDELSRLSAGSPAVTQVGYPPPNDSAWVKTQHSIPMGSLDKVQTSEELVEWIGKHGRAPSEALLLTEKLDGISISVTYEDGRLVRAVTRGDGQVGEDITSNVVRMKGAPQFKKGLSATLRGEIILHKADLALFPDKANPRNTASGTSKRFDGKGCEHLNVYFYQVHGPDFTLDSDQYVWLQERGFQTPNWYVVSGASKVQGLWLDYQQIQRDTLPYEIDGLVVRFNELEHQLALGELHGRPRGAVAFKFPAGARETVAVGLECQVGGQGNITPVAVVEPVVLLGAEVRRASLYNWAYIKQIGFYVGARVVITRSNDVIPRILSVLDPSQGPPIPPTQCPVCDAPTEQRGEFLCCSNTAECPAQVEGRLRKWVSDLDILEWGDVLIEKLVREGLATTVADLYRLTEEQLAGLDRMGPASAKKARDALWAAVPLTLAKFIGSLGIPLCALSTMEAIVATGIDDLDKLRSVDLETLGSVPGVGPKRAQSLRSWLDRNGPLLDDLLAAGVTIKPPVQGSLSGKSVCFTGKMETNRAWLEKRAQECGAQVKSSVGKGLTYLVIADPNSTSTKAQAARKNGTQCISEGAFLEMLK